MRCFGELLRTLLCGGLLATLFVGLSVVTTPSSASAQSQGTYADQDEEIGLDELQDWPRRPAVRRRPQPRYQQAPRPSRPAARPMRDDRRRPAPPARSARRYPSAERPVAYMDEGSESVVTERIPTGRPVPSDGPRVDEPYDDSWDDYDDGWGGYEDPGFGSGYHGRRSGGRVWVRAEYLLWWTRGMKVPPLVTRSPNGTDQADAGVLGQSGTQILFGSDDLFRDVRSGGRIRFGAWFDCDQMYGFEADFLGLENATESFSATSFGGDPILARPFDNALTGQRDAELVGFPGVVDGTVAVTASSQFSSAGIRWRANLCRQEIDFAPPGGYNACGSDAHIGRTRVDFLFGYRFMRLDENLMITEDLNSLLPSSNTQFDIYDRFNTETEFHGVDLGLVYEYQRCQWSFELLARLGLGNNRQRVQINGGTDITTGGITESYTGGLLAQRTNIGSYATDTFAVIPEIGLTVGYRVNNCIRFTAGYTFIYWSGVVRPGNQIDPTVNPNLLPPEAVPFFGPDRPSFAFVDRGFWAQGLNFGVQLDF